MIIELYLNIDIYFLRENNMIKSLKKIAKTTKSMLGWRKINKPTAKAIPKAQPTRLQNENKSKAKAIPSVIIETKSKMPKRAVTPKSKMPRKIR